MKITRKRVVLAALVALNIVAGSAVMKSSGPPACHAGEPTLRSNCTSCHSAFPLNSGVAEVYLNLGLAENGFLPGQEYDITLGLKKQGIKGGGFQLIALYDQNSAITPGSFILNDLNRTQLIDKNYPHTHSCEIGDKIWVEHTYGGISASNGEIKWNFKWKAPSQNLQGNITFYAAMLESNLDLTENGDRVYTLSKTISEKTNRFSLNLESNSALRYDPNNEELVINLTDLDQFMVLDPQGKALVTVQQPTFNRYPMSSFPRGAYFVKVIKKNGEKETTKIVK